MPNRIEISVCCDCLTLRESDDLSSFDYCYSEPEATARVAECAAGWEALDAQGRVFLDTHEDGEFKRCCECHHVVLASDITTTFDPEADEEVDECPHCNALDSFVDRDSGIDEFSWSTCDCCGSVLGGSRTRYALFSDTTESSVPGVGGPLVRQ